MGKVCYVGDEEFDSITEAYDFVLDFCNAKISLKKFKDILANEGYVGGYKLSFNNPVRVLRGRKSLLNDDYTPLEFGIPRWH